MDIGCGAAPFLPLVPPRTSVSHSRAGLCRPTGDVAVGAVELSNHLQNQKLHLSVPVVVFLTLFHLSRSIFLVPTQASWWTSGCNVFPTEPYLSPHLLQKHCRPALSPSQHCQTHQQSFNCTYNSLHPLRSCFLDHHEAQLGRLRQPGPCCRVRP
jgi:hypothetical protein